MYSGTIAVPQGQHGTLNTWDTQLTPDTNTIVIVSPRRSACWQVGHLQACSVAVREKAPDQVTSLGKPRHCSPEGIHSREIVQACAESSWEDKPLPAIQFIHVRRTGLLTHAAYALYRITVLASSRWTAAAKSPGLPSASPPWQSGGDCEIRDFQMEC